MFMFARRHKRSRRDASILQARPARLCRCSVPQRRVRPDVVV